jgi:hypothetical protein
MTTIDDDQLRSALRRAAASYGPSDGATTILSSAIDAVHERSSENVAEQTTGGPRSTRVRLAYAAAIVLAIVVGLTSLGFALRPTANDTRLATGAPSALSSHSLSGIANPSSEKSAQNSGLSQFGGSQFSINSGPTTSRSESGSPKSSLASKVVSTGTIAVSVPSGRINVAVDTLATLAAKEGGFVASSNVVASSNGAPAKAEVTLRVPQPHFGSLVAAVQKVGHATSVVTNSTDVTSEYVDYESQISALEDSRAQYVAIMKKATTISQILSVQAQLNTIEVELQQLEGQRNVLVNEAAYGTLTIKLNQGHSSVHPRSSIDRAWSQSISGFVGGVDGLVRALGPAVFALLCLVALWLVGRPVWRASRRRML